MPLFRVTAEEKFIVRTVYERVEAASCIQAIEKCKRGTEAYDDKEVLEGDEEWLKTCSVEEVDGAGNVIEVHFDEDDEEELNA